MNEKLNVASEMIEFVKQMGGRKSPYDGDGWCVGCGSGDESEQHKPSCMYIHNKVYLEHLNKMIKLPPYVGIQRSLIVKDIMDVDKELMRLQKAGKGVSHVYPLPHKANMKEAAEGWKTGKPDEEQEMFVEFSVSAMIIYQDIMLRADWEQRIKDGLVKDIK